MRQTRPFRLPAMAVADREQHAALRLGTVDHHCKPPARRAGREDHGQKAPVRILPFVDLQRPPAFAKPLDIRMFRSDGQVSGHEFRSRDRRVRCPRRRKSKGECFEIAVAVFPIEPCDRIVLCIGVVVAGLRTTELVARRQHDGSPRIKQGRQQCFQVHRPPRLHRGIVRLAFDTAVPREILVVAVAIVLAVGGVVLALVRDEIDEREPVMGGEEADASRCVAAAAAKDVGRAGKTRRERARHPGIAAPEAAYVVAVAVIPFEEPAGEVAELVSAGTDVPRFGDQDPAADFGIVEHCPEQRGIGIEAVDAPAEHRCKIEAEPVDAGMAHEGAQRVEHQRDHRRMGAVERVAAAGVVGERTVAEVAVGGAVVEPPQ